MTEFLQAFREKMAGRGACLYLLEEVDSTNTFAKKLRGGRPAVVLAARQTAGRGRLGRAWAAGTDDLCISFYYPSPVRDLLGLTLAAALAVVETVDVFCEGAAIKWPNDILLGGKKLVGILAESIFMGRDPQAVVIGVGINGNAARFNGELAEKAVSLKMATGKKVDIAELAFLLWKNMDACFSAFCREGFAPLLDAYTARSAMVGKEVTIHGKTGVCRGFSRRGGLLLARDGAVEELYFGEVSF